MFVSVRLLFVPLAFAIASTFPAYAWIAVTPPQFDTVVQAQAKARAKAKPKAKKVKQKEARIDGDDDGSARIWRYVRNAQGPLLSFGARKGDDILIAFSCQPGSGTVRIVAHNASSGTKRGDPARLRITSGKERLEVAGTAFADTKQKRLDVGGILRGTELLLDVFKGGETMIIELPGRKVGVSMKTLGRKGEQFAAACNAKN
jgi:hypothetical protein